MLANDGSRQADMSVYEPMDDLERVDSRSLPVAAINVDPHEFRVSASADSSKRGENGVHGKDTTVLFLYTK